MLHSFPIHEPQCRALFESREAAKPAKDRKPCPVDPLLLMRQSQGGLSGRGGRGTGAGQGNEPSLRIGSRAELDAVNASAMQVRP